MDTTTSSLAEDLLLLALHNERGTSQIPEKELRHALANATVMDLLLAGKIAAVDGHIIVVDRAPTNDPVRDHAAQCITAAQTRTTVTQCSGIIETGMPDLMPQLLDGLVARGVLIRQSHRNIGIVPAPDRFPEQDGRIEQTVRGRIRDVALHDTQPDARTAILATLIVGYRLDAGLFTDEERAVAHARLRDIARQLHERPATTSSSSSLTAAGFATTAHAAGASNVGGNAFVDVFSDIDFGVAFEVVFDILPNLLGGLLSAIFDS